MYFIILPRCTDARMPHSDSHGPRAFSDRRPSTGTPHHALHRKDIIRLPARWPVTSVPLESLTNPRSGYHRHCTRFAVIATRCSASFLRATTPRDQCATLGARRLAYHATATARDARSLPSSRRLLAPSALRGRCFRSSRGPGARRSDVGDARRRTLHAFLYSCLDTGVGSFLLVNRVRCGTTRHTFWSEPRVASCCAPCSVDASAAWLAFCMDLVRKNATRA